MAIYSALFLLNNCIKINVREIWPHMTCCVFKYTKYHKCFVLLQYKTNYIILCIILCVLKSWKTPLILLEIYNFFTSSYI